MGVEKIKTTTTVGPCGLLQLPGFVPAQKCEDWAHGIRAKREAWVQRNTVDFTFGPSWYRDIEAGRLHYYHALAPLNNQLIAALPGFLETMISVASLLEDPNGKVDLPVRPRRENLGPYWGDAGIHITEVKDPGPKGERLPGGTPHCDYEGLAPYPPMLFEKETRAYSAVLPLELAGEGGELSIWNQRRFLGNEFPDPEDANRIKPREMIYEIGTMNLFDSFLYHTVHESFATPKHPARMVGVVHFLYLEKPYPHFEHWF